MQGQNENQAYQQLEPTGLFNFTADLDKRVHKSKLLVTTKKTENTVRVQVFSAMCHHGSDLCLLTPIFLQVTNET
jgi:hypothetical protein